MVDTFYIETMGCQMNKLDSELIGDQLGGLGYTPTDKSETAGLIIFNTCSVRQHAEDKVISKIGQLRGAGSKNGGAILAIVGCMAQRLGQELLDSHEQVDIVCGPSRISEIGGMIAQVQLDRRQVLALNDDSATDDLEQMDTWRTRRGARSDFAAFVRVMRGCNKFCHYCIVPHVRGREHCRPIGHIVDECRRLGDSGVKEVTLLGQTINSYCFSDNGRGRLLGDVLEEVSQIEGIQRVRFATSYPVGFDEGILRAVADVPKVCEYLHIPAQSGSNRILRAMNRRYTSEQYVELIERARQILPSVSIAGDFIVGYCGEREEDFEATKRLLRAARYKNCFIFKYSPRPGTWAARKFSDDVPDEVKRRRNTELLDLQNEISLQDNQRFVGQPVEILVEGPSKKPHLDGRNSPVQAGNSSAIQLVGRTQTDHIVVFDGSASLAGRMVDVNITKASALTLFGESCLNREDHLSASQKGATRL